jgi:hypothetical protein
LPMGPVSGLIVTALSTGVVALLVRVHRRLGAHVKELDRAEERDETPATQEPQTQAAGQRSQ